MSLICQPSPEKSGHLLLSPSLTHPVVQYGSKTSPYIDNFLRCILDNATRGKTPNVGHFCNSSRELDSNANEAVKACECEINPLECQGGKREAMKWNWPLNITLVPLGCSPGRIPHLFRRRLLRRPVSEIMATLERKKAAPAMAKSSVKRAVDSTTSGQHSSPPPP